MNYFWVFRTHHSWDNDGNPEGQGEWHQHGGDVHDNRKHGVCRTNRLHPARGALLHWNTWPWEVQYVAGHRSNTLPSHVIVPSKVYANRCILKGPFLPNRSVFKPFIFVKDIKQLKQTSSPCYGPDDPVKKIPRFQSKPDRKHPLFIKHEVVAAIIDSTKVQNFFPNLYILTL